MLYHPKSYKMMPVSWNLMKAYHHPCVKVWKSDFVSRSERQGNCGYISWEASPRLFVGEIQLFSQNQILRGMGTRWGLKKQFVPRVIIFTKRFEPGIMSAGLNLILFFQNHWDHKICIGPVHTCQLVLSAFLEASLELSVIPLQWGQTVRWPILSALPQMPLKTKQ